MTNRNESIQEVKSKLMSVNSLDDPYLISLSKDERKGVISLKKSCEKRITKLQKEVQEFEERKKYEYQLHSENYKLIAGIDEVGRGPLAGPVVAAAVILPENFYCLGIKDSKKTSETDREVLFKYIINNAIDYGVGIIDSEIIDKINIYEATKKAMMLAIKNLKCQPDYLLIDAMTLDLPISQLSLIHGDDISISIGAASIVAKVTRDNIMKEYHQKYSEYDFENNKGYGTKKHIDGISKYGITPIHRKSFAPIKNML